jgi:hypothetical protein
VASSSASVRVARDRGPSAVMRSGVRLSARFPVGQYGRSQTNTSPQASDNIGHEMKTESQGKANARAQALMGCVVCGNCKRRLVFTSLMSGDGEEILMLWAQVKGSPGSTILTEWPHKKGVEYSRQEYREDDERKTRYRFVCLSPKCRSVTRDRGVVSYLDEDELPESGATVPTRLTKSR